MIEQTFYSSDIEGNVLQLDIAIGSPVKSDTLEHTWQCSLSIHLENGHTIYHGPPIMNVSPFLGDEECSGNGGALVMSSC